MDTATAEQVQVRDITPDDARELLGANDHNRKLRERRVIELVGAMERGEWQFNGDPIRIATTGRLLDGQHRLAAIERSGITQRTVVIEGLPESAQETMDLGKKRSVVDLLALRGEKNTALLGASARVVHNYAKNGTFRNPLIAPTVSQVLATIDAHPGLRDAARESEGVRKNTTLAPSVGAACFYLFGLADEADRNAFFLRLVTGVELQRTDPVYALRRIYTTPRSATKRIEQYVQGAYVIKAWNGWRAGAEVSHLVWRPGGATREPFPKIDGLPEGWAA